MESKLLQSYLSLSTEEQINFREKLWMLYPSESPPETKKEIDTSQGTVHYGDYRYYLRDRHGIHLTGYYDAVWEIEDNTDGAVLFELDPKPRYIYGEIEDDFNLESYNLEFIGEKIVLFISAEPVRTFKKSPKGYYAETDVSYILLPEKLELSRALVKTEDPYDSLVNY